jgi:hypothetical protein
MCLTYVVVVSLAALANGFAAGLNFAGAASVEAVADRLRVSRSWMIPFGALLAAGAAGLLAGFIVPRLGEAAASGLVLYFTCAVGAHVRAGDRKIGGAISFLIIAVAALIAEFAYHDHGC